MEFTKVTVPTGLVKEYYDKYKNVSTDRIIDELKDKHNFGDHNERSKLLALGVLLKMHGVRADLVIRSDKYTKYKQKDIDWAFNHAAEVLKKHDPNETQKNSYGKKHGGVRIFNGSKLQRFLK